MKVNKLIKLLQTFNQNADITTSISEDITISYITGRGQSCNEEYNQLTTPQVFIEPFDCQCCTCYDDCTSHNIHECDNPILEWIA